MKRIEPNEEFEYNNTIWMFDTTSGHTVLRMVRAIIPTWILEEVKP